MVARGNEMCCLADSASPVVRTGGPEPQGVEGVQGGCREGGQESPEVGGDVFRRRGWEPGR